jgi:L-histidine Nalpha-methyltransferase
MNAAASTAPEVQVDESLCAAVRAGLSCSPKRLPAWLFYDETGSQLFEEITGLPEYYLTRTERSILAEHAGEMIARAMTDVEDGTRLRIAELGAGSADKTRLVLKAAVERQGAVVYEPVDVSATALEAAQERIENEIPDVLVAPRVADYTQGSGHGIDLEPAGEDERVLVLYIGSSIGNFDPHEALQLLKRVRAGLRPGDALLLGVDLVKEHELLLAAYDDAAGITAAFNRNMLARLNRELGGEFDLEAFQHRAVWNEAHSRMEMHLESQREQHVRLAALDLELEFAEGERIHTESSYKYGPGRAEALLNEAGFTPVGRWTDEQGWFGVYLGRAS